MHIAASTEEMAAIERFRYLVYIREMHKPLPWADHALERLSDPLDEGALHFYSGPIDRITGYGRLHTCEFPRAVGTMLGIDEFLQQFGAPVAYMSKVMVDSADRCTMTTATLLRTMYVAARKAGCVVGFCHCNPRLVPLYRRLGLRELGTRFRDPYTGPQVAMVLIGEDIAHFQDTGSILLNCARHFSNDFRRVRQLCEQFFEKPKSDCGPLLAVAAA